MYCIKGRVIVMEKPPTINDPNTLNFVELHAKKNSKLTYFLILKHVTLLGCWTKRTLSVP